MGSPGLFHWRGVAPLVVYLAFPFPFISCYTAGNKLPELNPISAFYWCSASQGATPFFPTIFPIITHETKISWNCSDCFVCRLGVLGSFQNAHIPQHCTGENSTRDITRRQAWPVHKVGLNNTWVLIISAHGDENNNRASRAITPPREI